MDLYEQSEKYVIDSFTKADMTRGIPHFLRTTHWLLHLRPEADLALRIAAVSHDIERSRKYEDSKGIVMRSPEGFLDEEYLTKHMERGAQIMYDFLQASGADLALCKRVKHLISKHEVGGDDDSDLLKDADSVSFFENNANNFATKKADLFGKQKCKEKLDWMYKRITSDEAKEIARPWYDKSLSTLESHAPQSL